MKNIYAALVKCQSEIPDIKKNSTVSVKTKTGGNYSFNYATLENIVKTLKPILKENGLAYLQTVEHDGVKTTIIHSSGEQVESGYLPIDFSGSMQDIGSRITYAKRYSLAALLGVVAEDDDDGTIDAGNDFSKKPKIETWLTEDQFNSAMKANKQGIEATLKAFDGNNGKGMKKEYREQLTNKLKTL